MAYIIGIGGVSRSGKNQLAHELSKSLGVEDTLILDQDDFVFPEEEIPMVRDHIDWERPESINFNRLINAVDEAAKRYKWVIVEGLLAFWNEDLFNRYDLTIFMEISKETFWKRKATDLRWGAEPDWYIEYVWESFFRYGQFPKQDRPDVIVSGEG